MPTSGLFVRALHLCEQIFDEVEKRRQISVAMIYPFMQSLREAPFPAPGDTVNITSFIPESGTQVRAHTHTYVQTHTTQTHTNIHKLHTHKHTLHTHTHTTHTNYTHTHTHTHIYIQIGRAHV